MPGFVADLLCNFLRSLHWRYDGRRVRAINVIADFVPRNGFAGHRDTGIENEMSLFVQEK